MNKIFSFLTIVLITSNFIVAQDSTATEQIEEGVNLTEAVIEEKSDSSSVIVEESSDELLLIEEDDEFLISDDEEENILTTVDKGDSSEKANEEIAIQDSGKTVDEKVSMEVRDSTTKPDTVKTVEAKESKEKEIEEELVPIAIDSVKKINFAGNLENYKSPRKAMFRSLLLPGWGQAYAKKEWKTAIFAGIEVGAIVGMAVMNYLGKEKGKEARNFANNNYKKSNFVNFYEKYKSYVYSVFDTTYSDLSATQIDSIVDAVIVKDMYFDNDVDYYKSSESDNDLSDMWDKEFYIAGWNDFSDSPEDLTSTGYYFDDNGYHLDPNKYEYYASDTTWFIKRPNNNKEALLGYSSLREKYFDIRSEEDSYYNRGFIFMGALILNHVASAIDAFITAKGYNDKMLEKESVWRHLGVDNQLAYTAEEGVTTTLGVKIRF